jgi:hypothetical protein
MNNIENFLNRFMGSVSEENREMYRKIIGEGEVDKNIFLNYDKFYYGVKYSFEKFMDGMLMECVSEDRDVVFLMMNGRFVERHYSSVISKMEGSMCSVDKARTIVRSLIRYYKEGELIKFDYDGEYTYHLPKVIFKEQCRIIEFYEAVKSLYYGNSEKYMKIICMLHADVTNQLIM